MAHLILPSCTSCRDCVAVCPTESIFLGLNQYVIDRDTCTDCSICVKVCPVGAIHPLKDPEEKPESASSGSVEPTEHEED